MVLHTDHEPKLWEGALARDATVPQRTSRRGLKPYLYRHPLEPLPRERGWKEGSDSEFGNAACPLPHPLSRIVKEIQYKRSFLSLHMVI